ncbi:MAG: APC family permease [Terriglobia bacterium]
MSNNRELVQGLGVYGAASVAAGTMIGTAIFVVPGIMLEQAGTPLRVLGVWAVAGALSIFGALGYAELGAALPQAGGEYVYLHRAFGPGTGFLYGWTQFIVAKTASIAAIATGFLLYLAYFFPALSHVLWSRTVLFPGQAFTLRVTGLQAGSAGIIILLSALNVLGVRRSGAIQTAFTGAKLVVLAVLIIAGFAFGHGSWANIRASLSPHMRGSGSVAALGIAMISALWAYDGWNNLSMVAGEVKNQQRNIPLALIGASILVAVVYILVNLAYFHVMNPSQVASTRTVAAETARHLFGAAGGAFVAVGVLISTFATLNGSILAGSRIPYAQARDRLFPRSLALVNPRFHTPAAAIAAQAVIAAIFALSGSYETLYTKAIYSEWVFYALVTASIFVLRRKEPQLVRPYRTWGYPIVPATFIGLAGFLLANAFVFQRADALWSLALIGSGIPAYCLWKAFARP